MYFPLSRRQPSQKFTFTLLLLATVKYKHGNINSTVNKTSKSQKLCSKCLQLLIALSVSTS